MRNLTLICCLLFSFKTLAGFSGTWRGNGEFYTHRSEGLCSDIFLEIEDSEKTLKILTGYYICGYIQAEYPSSVFEKVQGELLYNGEKVGNYSKKSFNLHYLNGVYQLKIVKKDGSLVFHEFWKDEASLLDIKAKLFN